MKRTGGGIQPDVQLNDGQNDSFGSIRMCSY